MTLDALLRLVSEQPTAAAAANAAVMPGTTSKGTPASVSAANSSAARPKMSGSPLLRRTTLRWARACSIMSALISSCVMLFMPQRLPTLTISAWGGAKLRIACGNKVVVEDDVGGLNQAQRLDGEQIGIAGAGSYEIDLALRARPKRNRRSFDLACAALAVARG